MISEQNQLIHFKLHLSFLCLTYLGCQNLVYLVTCIPFLLLFFLNLTAFSTVLFLTLQAQSVTLCCPAQLQYFARIILSPQLLTLWSLLYFNISGICNRNIGPDWESYSSNFIILRLRSLNSSENQANFLLFCHSLFSSSSFLFKFLNSVIRLRLICSSTFLNCFKSFPHNPFTTTAFI